MVRVVIAWLLLMVLPAAAWAQAEKRVALVIGNSAYQHTPKLTNPMNDATDMVAALEKHGFQVLEGFDLDKAAFDRKVRDFANALQGAEAGVFFFAGHGLQVSGHNYLVPIDAQLTTVAALEFEMVRLDVVHRVMERLTNTNVLFLDACRDNPLARNLARAMGTRSSEIGRGLAVVESGVGTLISFSTQPGNVALDGTGRNSPFAGALVKHISASNDGLSDILVAVRNDVMKETQRKQVPWEHSALTGRFYFGSAPKTASPAPVAPVRVSEAAEAWDRTKDTTSVAALELFMAAYQNTYYAGLARLRIEELKKQQVAIATPPSAVTPLARPTEPPVSNAPAPLSKAEEATHPDQFPRASQFGPRLSFDLDAPAGRSENRSLGEIGSWTGLKATLWFSSVQESRSPGFFRVVLNPAENDPRVWYGLSISGRKGDASFVVRVVGWNGKFAATYFNKRVVLNEKLGVEMSWAIPGKLLIRLNGTEVQEISVQHTLVRAEVSSSEGHLHVANLGFLR